MSNTVSATGTTGTARNTTTSTGIPQTAAAGGLSFTQPPNTAAPSFYKIAPNNIITIGWNFTSLYSTPTHLTLSAYCQANGNTYPVGPTNGVIDGTAKSVTWDPYEYNQQPGVTPLAEASYTLRIVDERGPNVGAAPGLFSPNSQMTFALYKPQSYTPLSDGWSCTACSAGVLGVVSHPLSLGLIVTTVVMIVSGWHLLRNGFGGQRRP
ncbi:hypothetical protein DACRYDRAFT_96043 [Dacryopinax primogenitus]|uniref:DUF7137 domain-containing protein n=1 Tax=Dacryopinax primogenitus (strain DJM 731) TaxID=1858805 RepID=M5G041_DACPD|nr:uncharacterized protein DACRYDRAFT_96043 [Dacryopinax primogenitus]EJT99171.1 hypothetical protein DACRYDRAFT_96043 [Dacryopinax primogenitus]